MIKICIATGTRAEYGLLKPLIDAILKENIFELKLLVTGSHLSPEFGLTYKQIEADGHKIDLKVEMLLSSDTPEAIAKSMGLGIIGFADAFKQIKPDILILLGDRYEVLSLASAALIFKIPIAHLHGGEITEGAYDESIRHAVTKLSHLHFTSTETHRNRVIQLGENPDFVFNVGAIGIDNILKMNLLERKEIESELNIEFKKYNYILAFHPETLSTKSVIDQFKVVLDVIKKQDDSFFVFTKSNADTDGRIINKMMEEFVNLYPDKAALFSSLGAFRFLSLMKNVDAIIGNSSSGIIEAKSLNTATINIGDRQKGRLQPDSVINCSCDEIDLLNAFEKVKDSDFKKNICNFKNPYGEGNTAESIISVLKDIKLTSLHTKPFFDL
jgi:GDP/UDP-N,N'-diacetylbacillosamine 2-epimerase (hydrolysing)